ncbi:type VI secretion system baseplate subunit TssK [Granulicella tundricola]|uniref:Type VI secretion protein, VC_A0114 family n=1 Tax=Granulicella tundricola (strain ATCC BAA-1859 / DSM 23138 / MP5ACTX9) TaxID=1198114 RepID=E8X5S1_GRATM|nr:type VI secretion system baseplate subunit TssK [Granulicella tundricola]ADW70805.1 type VI secretion protein, VC_A0114 family [Granulicella tundricola MP5ACTX9]
MKFLSRVVWSEGMHLGPHHFQTQSRYFEDSLWFLSAGLRRNPWGLISLSLDTEAIRNGNVVLRYASGIFPDGLVFEIPDSDPAPPAVSLKDLFSPTDSEITLFLTVPKRSSRGLDCDTATLKSNAARYSSADRTITDDTSGQDEYTVAFGNKNLTLVSQAQLTPDAISFPLARIFRDGKGGFAVDPDFIPPALRISANENLLTLLKRLIETLNERIKTVSRGKKREGQFEIGSSSLDVANYWFLHALCSAIPSLQQHLDAKHSHPEELYLDLVRLSGALCTFSLESNPSDIPPYSHLHLQSVFHALDAHIRRHLEIVVPSNTLTLDFTKSEPYVFVANVNDERCFRRARWIFGIRSSLAESDLLRLTPHLVKICSAEGVTKLVQRALPGLELLHLSVPPSSMSAEADMHYFSISSAGACWQHILQTKRVGIYVPGDIRDAVFEITVILEANA